MTLHILLDSSPLGLLSKPARGTAAPIANWAMACLAAGHEIYSNARKAHIHLWVGYKRGNFPKFPSLALYFRAGCGRI